MSHALLARRLASLATLSGAMALSGCPATSDRPAADSGAPTAEVDTETVEVAEEDEALPGSDSASPPIASEGSGAAAENASPAVATEAPSESADPAVTLERPKDFLRPTLSDASLRARAEGEPTDPPEAVTDASAEAEDPQVLPGGTPVGDLFDGLEEKPSGESGD
jgi:hypothetical protein